MADSRNSSTQRPSDPRCGQLPPPSANTVAGDVTSYTLSAAEWGTLSGFAPGTFKWVIAGSDTFQYTTGSYWSDARGFTMVPTPGVLAMLGAAVIAVSRRRRH